MESEIVGNFVKVYLGLGLTIGKGDCLCKLVRCLFM